MYTCSDGCASQFRSRFVFSFLSHFHLENEIEWHFNEAHHGKGPMDGVGGSIKNKAFREIKSFCLTKTSPEKFSNAAERLASKIVDIVSLETFFFPKTVVRTHSNFSQYKKGEHQNSINFESNQYDLSELNPKCHKSF